DEVMMLARCGGLNGGDEPAVMAAVVRDRVDRSGGVVYGVGGGSPEAQQNHNPEAGQTSMGRDGQIFMYNPDYLREQSCGFGDSRGLHSTTLTIEQTTRCSRTLCNQDTLM
ncbi:hypothetical protein Tco_0122761, partial [Tanacetum coccineum]